MASKHHAPLCVGLDRGARPSADEGLGHFHISRARNMIEIRAEVAVGRPGQFLEVGEVEALVARTAGFERRHDAQPDGLVDDLVRAVHRSGPPHPEAAENDPSPGDGKRFRHWPELRRH
jgi:hypothetical protein